MIVPPVPVPATPVGSNVQTAAQADAAPAFSSIMLRSKVQRAIVRNEKLDITTGVNIMDMQSGQHIVGHNLDTEQFAASINKVPVAALIMRDVRMGNLRFDQVLTWSAGDVRAGNGTFDQPDAPLQATVKDVLFDLLNRSGNTAVRVLVNQGLGGAAQVNTRITNELLLQHTYLEPLDADRFYLGNTTPRDAITALNTLVQRNDTYGQFLRGAMATNIYGDYGVRTQLAGNEYIMLSNKVGILDDAAGNNRHDVGIIYNTKTARSYGYAFMNTAPGEPDAATTTQAAASLSQMGAPLLRYAGDAKPKTAAIKAQATMQLLLAERRIDY